MGLRATTAQHGPMETLILIMVPFGCVAVLAGAGATSAVRKALVAEDTLRRTELWIMFSLLSLLTLFSALGAWWWWAGWSNFGF
jgi:hypothetical protein